MKRLLILLVIFFLFLPLPVFAQQFNDNERAFLPKSTVVNGDYFAAGELVTISGTVNGDVYAAGGTVIVDGTVNGDVLAAGGAVTISGTVSDDVRVGGGNVTVSGDIGKNLTLGTGNGTITSDAQINGSIVGGAGTLTIMSPIGKNAVIGGGTLVLGNVIKGNVTAGAGTITVNENARIQGDFNYTAEDELMLEEGASISGQIVRHEPQTYEKPSEGAAFAGKFVWTAITFVITFIFGSILLFFLPNFFKNTVLVARSQPLQNLGIGFLTVILSPIIIILLCLTFIGIPFALIWLFIFIVDLVIAKLFIAYLLGQKVHETINAKTNRYVTFFTGLLLYKIVTFIPIVGPLIGIIATLIGFGALMLQKKATYQALRKKEEI